MYLIYIYIYIYISMGGLQLYIHMYWYISLRIYEIYMSTGGLKLRRGATARRRVGHLPGRMSALPAPANREARPSAARAVRGVASGSQGRRGVAGSGHKREEPMPTLTRWGPQSAVRLTSVSTGCQSCSAHRRAPCPPPPSTGP